MVGQGINESVHFMTAQGTLFKVETKLYCSELAVTERLKGLNCKEIIFVDTMDISEVDQEPFCLLRCCTFTVGDMRLC